MFLTQPHAKTSSTAFTAIKQIPIMPASQSQPMSFHEIPCQTKWQKILWQYNLCDQQKISYAKQQIKPGLSLYKSFLKGQQLQKLDLKINLPQTLIKDEEDNIYILYTQKQKLKKRKINNLQQYENFVKLVNRQLFEKQKTRQSHKSNYTLTVEDFNEKLNNTRASGKKSIINKTRFSTSSSSLIKYSQKPEPNSKYRPYTDYKNNQFTPFLITRIPSQQDQTLFQKQLYTYKRFNEQKCKPSKNKVIQRYIFSRNLKAMLIRFCYHTKSSGSTQQNFAYRVQNNDPIFKYFRRTQSYETSTVLATIVINQNKQNTFQFSKLFGKCLKPYEQMSQSLTKFFQKTYSIRIKKMFIDFIVDVNQTVWLTNLKYIQLDNSIQLSKLNLDNQLLTCTAYCKLCGMIYKRDEVSKNLTYKLLYQLVEHLKKRTRNQDNANVFLHQLKFNVNINKPCQLCNLCYMLVVSQHELIQVQKTLAKIMNIKVKQEIKVEISDPKTKKRPAYLPDKLKQWRLMLYFSQINQFSNLADKNLHLQYKINNLSYLSQSLKFPDTYSKNVPLNQIKLHYFFSQNLNIQKFLSQSQILIRVTQGPDWSKCIAQGSSGTISHFKNKVAIQSGQRHSSTILLFFQDSKFCQVLLTVGLVCDGTYNTSQINLYKQKEIYLTENTYHNVNPLPKEWMEMFSPKYALKMMDATKNCTYTPLSTYDEIRKMIGIKNLRADNNKKKMVNNLI